MNKTKFNKNIKQLKNKDKKICNYCLIISAKLIECDKCHNLFCNSCMIELKYNFSINTKNYCINCMINYIKTDVKKIIEK